LLGPSDSEGYLVKRFSTSDEKAILTRGLGLLVVSLLVICGTLVLGKLTKRTDVTLASNEAVVFTDATGSAGVSLTAPQWGGVWGDYDGDGLQDFYAGNHFDTPNLYHNNGDGAFTDVRAQAGIKSGPDDWHGAAWGDANNDGKLDLYVVTGQAVNGSDFYVNNGNGTFTERAQTAGVKNDPGRGRESCWFDYDLDGDLDLFVANENKTTAPTVLYRNNNDGTFTDVAAQAGVAITTGVKGVACTDYDRDGYPDLLMVGTISSGTGLGFELYRNPGNSTFVKRTTAAGFSKKHYPQSAAWGDYDNDGDLDLYFTRGDNGFEDKLVWNTKKITAIVSPPNSGEEGLTFSTTDPAVTFDLWLSDRKQLTKEVTFGSTNKHPSAVPFTLNTTTSHIGKPSYTPGVTEGTFIWRDSPTAPWNIRWSRSGSRIYDAVGVLTTPGEFSGVGSIGFDVPSTTTKKNALYKNNGNGTFTEVTNAAGMEDSLSNSRDAQWIDFDNDGDLDLYVTNHGNTYIGNEPNRLYRNNGNGTFTEVATTVGLLGPTEGNDTCSAWADYNNDGFLDAYVANATWTGYLAGPHKLYRNGGNSNHWLQIRLVGVISNRLGVGAKVKVTTGALTQFREVGVDATGACRNSLLAHFGLQQSTQVDVIIVTWPSGIVQTLQNIAADQVLVITEGS
jgi:ASPIC/UnbV protein/VCBS repeat protein